jgi:hypothetical protein
MFDFRFNTPTPFPESGSRKRFLASRMRGIDFLHKITPRNVFFTKIFSENGLRLSPPPRLFNVTPKVEVKSAEIFTENAP